MTLLVVKIIAGVAAGAGGAVTGIAICHHAGTSVTGAGAGLKNVAGVTSGASVSIRAGSAAGDGGITGVTLLVVKIKAGITVGAGGAVTGITIIDGG